jgi:hypothetical protein
MNHYTPTAKMTSPAYDETAGLNAEALINYFSQVSKDLYKLFPRTESLVHILHQHQVFPSFGVHSILIDQFASGFGDVHCDLIDIKPNDPFKEGIVEAMIASFKERTNNTIGHILLNYPPVQNSMLHRGTGSIECPRRMIDKLANTLLFGPDHQVTMKRFDNLDKHAQNLNQWAGPQSS